MSLVYKLIDRPAWEAAAAKGVFEGSAVDLADGFIHLSSAFQAPETARRYFAGQSDLLLVAIDAEDLGVGLRWEPSRGGDLFPHLYGSLPTAMALWTRPLALGPDGAPILGYLA